ncbi:MAG: AMP-binding protein [Azoarcus sp.]|nr:AMP-binding protein [Azoarcus sp.]
MAGLSAPLPQSLTRYWRLPERGGDTFPVAWRDGLPIPRSVFYLDLAAAQRTLARLHPGDVEGNPGLALFEPDAYCFAVWLLAAWSLGLAVILPGDDLPSARESLALPWVGSGSSSNAVRQWESADVSGPEDVPDYGKPSVKLYTSGSTGKPSLVDKSLRQLRAEAEMFENAFGAYLTPEARFITSVPHQHMYGLPFFMLWSLTAGHPFVVEKLRFPEDLGRLPPADYVFISAPTYLKHLVDAPEPLPGVRFLMATSAGSPLPLDVARYGADWMKAPLFEIYGSTETGATARRQADAPWQPMPGVRLALEKDSSRLRIFSPLLSDAELESGFLSNDIARLDEQGLVLQGRADRVVKIGEKRVSLTQVEQELARLPEVDSARVVPLPHEGEGERVMLGAVIILSEAGAKAFGAEKKALFDTRLRNSLHNRLEPLALPRRWRYVDAFPVNEMGKITRQELERLFLPTVAHAELLPLPLGTVMPEGEEKIILQLKIPANLIWFEGHFPGAPVLPGVVQIDWAAWFARFYLGFDAGAANISNIKFQHAFKPHDAPRLEMVLRKNGAELEFFYTLGDKTCLNGTFLSRKP